MLTGENGILRQAGNAKEETEIAGELEKVQLAVTSAMTQSYGNLTQDAINSSFQEQFGEQPVKSEIGYIYESNITKYVIKENGEIATAKKGYDNAGTMAYTNIGTTVTGIKCNYGAGETETNITEWQILNIESENIYLISQNKSLYNPDGSMHFNFEKITSTDINGIGRYKELAVNYLVNKNEIKYKHIADIANKWLSQYVMKIKNNETGYVTNNNINIRATLYMLDTEIWQKDFITTITGKQYGNDIEYLIGSPTVEMFCDSYNKYNNLTGTSQINPTLESWLGYAYNFGAGIGYEFLNIKGESYFLASPSNGSAGLYLLKNGKGSPRILWK